MSCFQEVLWCFWPLEKLGENKGPLRQAKKTKQCVLSPTGTSSGCYICCCSHYSGGEFGCIWGSRRLRRYQNLRAAPARKLHRLAENKGVRGGQDVKGSQSIKHKQPTANNKKKRSTRSEAPRGWATGSARTIQQEDNKAAAAAKETEKLKIKEYKKSTSAMVQFSLLGLIFIFFIFMAIAQMHQRPQLFLQP